PDGTPVDTLYHGVKFMSCTTMPMKRWSAYARLDGPGAFSRPNVISVNQSGGPGFDSFSGGIVATFDVPQIFVSIEARPIADAMDNQLPILNRPYIQPIDEGGIASWPTYYDFSLTDPNNPDWQQLVVSSTTRNIKQVVFSSEYLGGLHVFAVFDNLVFA